MSSCVVDLESGALRTAVDFVGEECKGLPSDTIFKVETAVLEGLGNLIRHSNDNKAELTISQSDSEVIVEIAADSHLAFGPAIEQALLEARNKLPASEATPTCDLTEGGYGSFLIGSCARNACMLGRTYRMEFSCI